MGDDLAHELRLRLPVMENEKDQILILAGDIITHYAMEALKPFFVDVNERFKRVLFIPGNHEFWYGVLPDTWFDMINKIYNEWGLTNFSFQDHEVLLYDADINTRVIASTLWTDFNDGNPLAMTYAHSGMVDYEVTKLRNGAPLKPIDILGVHQNQRSVVLGELAQAKHLGMKVLVVTHHAPLRESTHPKYKGHAITDSFASDMGDEVAAFKPDVWVHGHMHDAITYDYADTKVICNPCGYPSDVGRSGYNPTLVVEL